MKYRPTEEQIRMAETLMTAMAQEDLIRPVVEAYETSILEKHRFHIDPEWVDMGHAQDQVILDRKRTFLLSNEDSKVFQAECSAARDAANLPVSDPRNCPLLEVENLRIEAENALLRTIETVPGLEGLSSRVLTLEWRKRAIDLSLKLLARYCGNAQQILKRFTT